MNCIRRLLYLPLLLLLALNNLIAQTNIKPVQQKPLTSKERKQQLKEVIIQGESASRKEAREIRESPFAVSVLEGKTFANKATGIEEVLNQIPGIKIRNEGGLGSTSQLNIHGLEGRRVSFFINGEPIYAPGGTFNITDIPVQVIKRIEVYKGIVPAKYGADGLGGAINIETLDIYDRDYMDLTYQYGSFNTHRSTVILKKWFEKPGILLGVSGFFNYSDNNYMMDVPDQGIRVRRNHDKYISSVPSMKITFKKWWFDEASLEANYYLNRKDIQGLKSDIRYAQNKSDILIAGMHLEKKDFFLRNLELKYVLQIPLLQSRLTDTSHYIRDYKGNSYYSAIGGEIDNMPHELINNQHTVINRLNLSYSFNERHNINLNSNLRYSNQTMSDAPAFKLAGYNTSGYPGSLSGNVTGLAYLYTGADNRLQNQLLLKLYQLNSKVTDTKRRGMQGTPPQNANSEFHIGYGDGISFLLFPVLRVKASYEHTFRLPDPEELFGDGILIAPANKLVAERSDNFNAGLQLDKKNFLGMTRFQWDVSGFYMRINNMIRLLSDGIIFGYANVDKAKVAGIETEIKADITDNWYVHTNFTWQDLRDRGKCLPGTTNPNPTQGLRLPNTPWRYGSVGLEYHKQGLFHQKKDNSRIYLESSYTGSYYFNWKISALQDRAIPEVLYHNAGIEQSFKNGRYLFGVAVSNITNEKIYNQYNMPLPGRAVNIKFRYIWFPEDKRNDN